MNLRNVLLIIGVIVGIPVLYNVIMWLIVDYQLPPEIITVLIIYVILIYPQYISQHQLRKVDAFQDDDEDYMYVKPRKSNWILFFNDYELANYFGNDNIFKVIIAWLMRISIPVFILSASYVNFLVVFIDLGVTPTIILMNAQTISLIIYIVTKSIIVGYFLNMFKGPVASILGLFYPIGLLYLHFAIRAYLEDLEEVQTEDRFGMSYE